MLYPFRYKIIFYLLIYKYLCFKNHSITKSESLSITS